MAWLYPSPLLRAVVHDKLTVSSLGQRINALRHPSLLVINALCPHPVACHAG